MTDNDIALNDYQHLVSSNNDLAHIEQLDGATDEDAIGDDDPLMACVFEIAKLIEKEENSFREFLRGKSLEALNHKGFRPVKFPASDRNEQKQYFCPYLHEVFSFLRATKVEPKKLRGLIYLGYTGDLIEEFEAVTTCHDFGLSLLDKRLKRLQYLKYEKSHT